MLTSEVFLIIAACAVLLSAALTPCAFPILGILQQEGYACGALLKWYFKRGNMLLRRYSLLSLCLVLVCALLMLCFSFLGEYAHFIAGLGFLGMCGIFLFASRRALKVPLKGTKRAVRLVCVLFLLIAGALFGVGVGLYCAASAVNRPLMWALYPVPVALFPLFLVLFCALAGLLAAVYEIPRARHFIKRARRTIQASECVKVGITGSFGKTSVKHIAAQLLKDRRVIATPASFNTPIGIARCVNEGGLDCDVFLCEFGARKAGDIAELCELVRPEVGVVTGVCAQHLESFGSLEAIKKEKGVLARYCRRAVLGETAAFMREDALLEGRDFAAEDVGLFPDRTEFTLRVGGERYPVKTPLLGRHAAEDIALAVMLCTQLGAPMSEILPRISSLEPVEHRLCRTVTGAGVTILDDAYNSNPEGAKNAVEVLKLHAGRKAVVTPGLVELGELEESTNEALGALLVGLDRVILVGETRVLAVRKGYVEAGGDESRLAIVPTLAKAQELFDFSAGDCVLFLNDLPDKY